MSSVKITCAFVAQEAAIQQALSPKNPNSGVVEQLSHALQWDSPQMASSEGFSVSAQLLRSPCQYAINGSHFHIFDNTEEVLFFRCSNDFAFRNKPVLSWGSPFLAAGDGKRNARAPAMKVYRFSFPLIES